MFPRIAQHDSQSNPMLIFSKVFEHSEMNDWSGRSAMVGSRVMRL